MSSTLIDGMIQFQIPSIKRWIKIEKEIVGDNTSRTAATPTWKVVMVRGEPERFSLEL